MCQLKIVLTGISVWLKFNHSQDIGKFNKPQRQRQRKRHLENIGTRYLYCFATVPIPSPCTMWPNYRVIGLVFTAFKLRRTIKYLLSCTNILDKTLKLVISSCCLAEYGEEIYQNLYTSRAGPLFFFFNRIVLCFLGLFQTSRYCRAERNSRIKHGSSTMFETIKFGRLN